MNHTAPPLSGLRVLELGDTIADGYVGRLFCDLGAQVVKVERPEGDPLRRREPLVGGEGPSAAGAYFHAGKRSVMADPDSGDGDELLRRLALVADVIVGLGGPAMARVASEVLDDVEAANPAVVLVDVSTFGATGPCAGEAGGDLVALAASGILSLTGTDPVDPHSAPLRYRGELSSVFAALHAVIAALGGVHARLTDGRGDRLEVSTQEAMLAVMATAVATYTYTGQVPVRSGRRGVCPWGFYPCQDGLVLVQITEDSQWRALVKILGDPEWGHLELFATTASRVELSEAVEPLVADAMSQVRVDEFLAAAHDAGVAASRVHTAEEVVAWDHLQARAYLQPIELNGHGAVIAPTAPYRLSDAPPPSPRRLARVGEDTDDVTQEWSGFGHAGAASGGGTDRRAPLAGLRVIDLTWVWAGPCSTMQLAHLGAEVIKIESTERVDVTRRLAPFVDDVPGVDRSGYFNQYNQGKKSVTLDLSQPAGKDLLSRLIASADVVVDNLRAGALERMGFGYERIRQLNPRIVAVSLTGFGESGPERDRLAYGSIIDALSGVASVTGPPGGGPADVPMSLPDPCAGLHAAVATLAALYRARVRGIGARVECSMLEAWISAQPWGVLGVSATGRQPAAIGNRDEAMSPHGVFACRGEMEWVAVAVQDDAQFERFADAIGRGELAVDARFATLDARRSNEAELEGLITAWTSVRDPAIVVAALRGAGVPTWRVERMDAVVDSEHLRARNFFVELAHLELGARRLAGVPWRTTGSAMAPGAAAPRLGEHTRPVLRDVLEMTDQELDQLKDAGVLR